MNKNKIQIMGLKFNADRWGKWVSAWCFNSLKTTFFATIKKATPASVSAFFSKEGKLTFVQTENYYATHTGTPAISLNEELYSGSVKRKIEGTINALSEIVSHYKKATDFTEYFNMSKREKIKTLVLVNMPDRDFLKVKLGNNDVLRGKDHSGVTGDIVLMLCEDFQDYCI